MELMETKENRCLKKKWPRKNLGQLVNFLERTESEGLSLEVLAKRLGVTKGSISNVFCHDDMKLSRAEEIAKLYGHRLSIYYPVQYYGFEDGLVPCEKKKAFPNAGNLTGLINYIQQSDFNIAYTAKLAGLSPNILYRAFNCGDIMISTLNRCTDALGITSIWEFEKIQ